jgi:hypothetical protein
MTYRRDQRKKGRRVRTKFYMTDGAGLEPGESRRFNRDFVEFMKQREATRVREA